MDIVAHNQVNVLNGYSQLEREWESKV